MTIQELRDMIDAGLTEVDEYHGDPVLIKNKTVICKNSLQIDMFDGSKFLIRIHEV